MPQASGAHPAYSAVLIEQYSAVLSRNNTGAQAFEYSRDRGIKAMIPEPDDQKGHRKRRGSRGGRPVGPDAADYRNRNVIERQYGRIKQWRGIATRYDKHAIVYRAAVVFNPVIAWAKTLSDTL